MAMAITKKLENEKQQAATLAEKREYYSSLNRLYTKIKNTGERWLGNSFYEVSDSSFNPFLPCSRDVWVERHPEGLPARLYINTKDLKTYPTIEELEKVKVFWDSLTDAERASVDEMYKEIFKK